MFGAALRVDDFSMFAVTEEMAEILGVAHAQAGDIFLLKPVEQTFTWRSSRDQSFVTVGMARLGWKTGGLNITLESMIPEHVPGYSCVISPN